MAIKWKDRTLHDSKGERCLHYNYSGSPANVFCYRHLSSSLELAVTVIVFKMLSLHLTQQAVSVEEESP